MASRGTEREAFQASIYGRVQGVGFRYSACREAEGLGITGWVRNGDEGEVEVHAEGKASSLRLFALWLESGPPGARVDRVDLRTCAAIDCYTGFTVDY